MPDTTDNGRITLAVIATKLDRVLKDLDDIKQCQVVDHDRLANLEATAKDNKNEIDRLRERDTAGNIITGIGALIAAILGAWGIRS